MLKKALTPRLAVIASHSVGAVTDLVVDGINRAVLNLNVREEVAQGMGLFLDDPGREGVGGAWAQQYIVGRVEDGGRVEING